MKKSLEVRWHGRGGQGAKTAALLLADVAFKTGAYVQGFPEYGPERMGAPITAYNRISDTPIRVHSNIYDPQFVVVVDEITHCRVFTTISSTVNPVVDDVVHEVEHASPSDRRVAASVVSPEVAHER